MKKETKLIRKDTTATISLAKTRLLLLALLLLPLLLAPAGKVENNDAPVGRVEEFVKLETPLIVFDFVLCDQRKGLRGIENARRIFLAAFVAAVEASLLAGIIITCGGGDALGNDLMFCAAVHSVSFSVLVMWVVVLFAVVIVVVVLAAVVISAIDFY
ncbi:hypothetical protein FF38_11520 [Lucilia cuprina]|uniref:MARVEL domain-containing protein n=1 Tax=Lucilia cuprina TaxID=7375 RepID=A0A0L0CDH5_LUCCU|nr:hypothetical protein FF38_11520 [Lucilia cuprina]